MNKKSLANSLGIILSLTVILVSCAAPAGNSSGSTARITIGSGRTVNGYECKNIVLKGSLEGGGTDKTLKSWDSESKINGTTIEVESGNWVFTLICTANYEERKASVKATLEPDTTTSLSFTTAPTGRYVISADEIGSWSYANSGTINLTVSNATNSNVGNIGNFIRSNCSANVNLTIESKGLTTLPYGAKGTFEDCSKLSSINLPAGIQSLGKKAFSGCNNITAFIIPDGVTSIGEECFYLSYGNKLASITIPSSVTTIEKNAFAYTTKLTDINYSGSKSSWQNIVWNTDTVDNAAFDHAFKDGGSGATIHCSNGDCNYQGYD